MAEAEGVYDVNDRCEAILSSHGEYLVDQLTGQTVQCSRDAKWIKRESGLVFTAAAEDNMESGV